MYKWTKKGIVERYLAAAPLGNLTWPRMGFPSQHPYLFSSHTKSTPDLELTGAIRDSVRALYPRWLLCYRYTTSYGWAGNGFSLADVKDFLSKMAKQGAVFQIQPTWIAQGIRHYVNDCAKLLQKEGIARYLRDIQKPCAGEEGEWTGDFRGVFDGYFFFLRRLLRKMPRSKEEKGECECIWIYIGK